MEIESTAIQEQALPSFEYLQMSTRKNTGDPLLGVAYLPPQTSVTLPILSKEEAGGDLRPQQPFGGQPRNLALLSPSLQPQPLFDVNLPPTTEFTMMESHNDSSGIVQAHPALFLDPDSSVGSGGTGEICNELWHHM